MKNFFEQQPQKPGKPQNSKNKNEKNTLKIEKEQKEFEEIKERSEKLEESYKNLKIEIENINFIEEAKKFFELFSKLAENYLKIFNEFKKLQPQQKEKYKERVEGIESSLVELIKRINAYIVSYILTKNPELIQYLLSEKLNEEKYKIKKEAIIVAKVIPMLNGLFGKDENYLRFFNYIETFWWKSNLEEIKNNLLKGLFSEKIEKNEILTDIETKIKDIDNLLNAIRKILKRYEIYLKEKLNHPTKTKIMIHKNIIEILDKKFIIAWLDIFENNLNQIRNYLRSYRFNDINTEIERIQYLMDSIKF
jgi:hypothetical protein